MIGHVDLPYWVARSSYNMREVGRTQDELLARFRALLQGSWMVLL